MNGLKPWLVFFCGAVVGIVIASVVIWWLGIWFFGGY